LCGAITKRGQSCKLPRIEGQQRCHLHGGRKIRWRDISKLTYGRSLAERIIAAYTAAAQALGEDGAKACQGYCQAALPMIEAQCIYACIKHGGMDGLSAYLSERMYQLIGGPKPMKVPDTL
jgi:hypothetical protein